MWIRNTGGEGEMEVIPHLGGVQGDFPQQVVRQDEGSQVLQARVTPMRTH
jgi:hypothetical protein